jgi:hypothetical protein
MPISTLASVHLILRTPTTRWAIWELLLDSPFQVNQQLRQEAKNRQAEVDLLAFSDQVMEVVDRVAVKTEQFLRWKTLEWRLGSMELMSKGGSSTVDLRLWECIWFWMEGKMAFGIIWLAFSDQGFEVTGQQLWYIAHELQWGN